MTALVMLFSVFVQAGELKFDSFSQVVFFLDATSSSCDEILNSKLEKREAAQDIKSIYFQIPNPALSYTSENPNSFFRISEIRMELDSPKIEGGRHVCSLKDRELSALFAKDAENRWSGELSPNTQLGTSAFCKALKCGGVILSTPGGLRVKTDLRVIGKEIDRVTGAETPLEALKAITIYRTN